MNNMNEWLNSLKPGDDVLIEMIHKQPHKGTVDRLTQTMIIVNCGKNGSGTTLYRRFRLKNGYAIGEDCFYTACLKPCTPERLKELKQKRLRNSIIHQIRNTNWHNIDDRTLNAVNAIIENRSKSNGN
jgi:hypothetical protein